MYFECRLDALICQSGLVPADTGPVRAHLAFESPFPAALLQDANDGILDSTEDRDAPHRPSTRKGSKLYICPILMKNKGRNTTFSSFLLKYRGRTIQIFQRPEKGGRNMEEHM